MKFVFVMLMMTGCKMSTKPPRTMQLGEAQAKAIVIAKQPIEQCWGDYSGWQCKVRDTDAWIACSDGECQWAKKPAEVPK